MCCVLKNRKNYFIPLSKALKVFHILVQKHSPGGVLSEKVLEISQNSQENTCARVSILIKLQVNKSSELSSSNIVTIKQILELNISYINKISKRNISKLPSGTPYIIWARLTNNFN